MNRLPMHRGRGRCGSRGELPAFAAFTLVAVGLAGLAAATVESPQPVLQPAGQVAGEYAVPPPPLSEGVFPCSECHKDIATNPERRVLSDAHEEIVLEHDTEHRWCLDCHSADNRDMLKLASGQLIDFGRSYLLCGQCHGDKFRDWKVGVHGKRIGRWNGDKQYLLCVHCHNPHSPLFKPVPPMPRPVRPGSRGRQEFKNP